MNPWNSIIGLTNRGTGDGHGMSERTMRATLAAAVLVPLLALDICLGAFWAPDDHTQGLPVALVNLDQGDTRNGTTTNAGDDLVKQVTSAGDLRWKTTSAADANAGVADGTYAFSVTIPADFSAKIADASSLDGIARSVAATGEDTTGALASASIAIHYDDANNAQARAMGTKAMEAIRKALSQSVGQTTASTLLVTISQLDQGLSGAADGSKALGEGAGTLKKGVDQLGDGLGQLATGADGMATGNQTLATSLDALDAQMPALATALGQLAQGASGVATGNQTIADQVGQLAGQANQYRDQAVAQVDAIAGQLDCADGGIDTEAIATALKQAEATARADAGDAAATMGAAASDAAQSNRQTAQSKDGAGTGEGADAVTDAAPATQKGTDADSDTPASEESGDPGKTTDNKTTAAPSTGAQPTRADLAAAIQLAERLPSISQVCATLEQTRGQLAAIPDLTQSEQVRQINALAQGAQSVADGMNTLNGQSSQLTDGINALAQGARTLGDGAQTLAQGAHAASDGTDALSKGAGQLTDGIGKLGDGLRQGADAVPTLTIGGTKGAQTGTDGTQGTKDSANSLADTTKSSDGTGKSGSPDGTSSTADAMRTLDAFNALRNTTAVMTDPVRTTSTTGNQAGTLGMALAPMLIACALALGAMLAYGMLRAIPARALAGILSPWRAVAGGYLPALALGVAETLVMIAVLAWGMGARAVNPVMLVLAAALTAAAFMALQQLLVLVWGGRLGAMAALALHVLGFAACGGLYPQAVMPMPLRVIAPAMPATHAVDAMRVALTGGAPATLLVALAYLLTLTLVCLAVSAWVAARHRTWTVARLHAA